MNQKSGNIQPKNLGAFRATPCNLNSEGGCITCSDEALPAKVLAINAHGFAQVSANNEIMEVDITLVDRVEPGDILLVHAGVALSSVALSSIKTAKESGDD